MSTISLPIDLDLRSDAERAMGSYRRARYINCPDGWYIRRTTTPLVGGDHEGKFAVVAYKPVGKGSRSGGAKSWELVYFRAFNKRSDAKKRCHAIAQQHGWGVTS